ncbi:MAG TPA: hypothetical protein VM432_14185 [Bdellovibrionales bacterium]|nr:hypothetical protein [Bdellovibrionales bacterium]
MKHIFLPKPLLHPEDWDWPRAGRSDCWALPLRIATETGGPLLRYFNSVIETGAFVWWDNPKVSASALANFVQEDAAQAWLKKNPDILKNQVSTPSFSDWAADVLPETRSLMSDIEWHRALKDYAREMGLESEFSLSALRYFSGYLRKTGSSASEQATLEWSRVQCLFSLEPVVSIVHPGKTEGLVLNPATAFIRLHAEGVLRGIARIGEELIEHDLDWQQAAFIDELHEDGIASRAHLLGRVGAKRGLERARTDEAALSELESLGFII